MARRKKIHFEKRVKLNKKLLLIPIAIITLSFCFFGIKMMKPNVITTSINNIEDIKENVDALSNGDIIKYNINGVDEWKVLYVDKENNSVDVVSNYNTTEIEITPDNYQEAENLFNAEAEKFYDNKYVISTRTVSKGDLDYFAFDQKFWLSNINEETISYNTGFWKYKYDNPRKLYTIPYITINKNDGNNYSRGDEYNISINNISDWYVYYDYGNQLVLVPKMPIEVEVTLDMNISDYLNQLYNDFLQAGAIDSRSMFDQDDPRNVFQLYNDYYREKNEEVFFVYNSDSHNEKKDEYDKFELYCTIKYFPKEDRIDWCYNYEYKKAKSLKIGYRPVLTLQFPKKKNSNKELSNELNVGDYVKYSANDYDGWKVLSIDKEKNEIEIISSGIVKNMQLKGKDSYDNLESILQNEVDKYISGDNVISARSVEYKDQKNLDLINDNVSVKYWLNNKKEQNENIYSYNTSSPLQLTTKYNVAVMNYREIDDNMYTGARTGVAREWVTLYYGKNSEEYIYISFQYEGFGFRTYTAGIRPVIKIKLDTAKKLEPSEIKKVEENTSSLNKTLKRKQESENKDNNNNNNNNTGKNKENNYLDDSSNKNNNNITSFDEDGKYNSISVEKTDMDKLYKYIFIVILLLFSINILLILNIIFTKLTKKDLSK